jgi:hypothetical protein
MPVSPDDPRLAKCGFAKLVGPDVELYMRKYELTIGRKSKSTALDVVLGDNMNISRLHAKINYNFQTARFELTVLGKNGVTVKGTLHTPNSAPVVLQSQDLLQIGESSFWFLLPKDLSKIRATGKRKRPSSSGAGMADARATTTTASEEDGYSEDYDAQYQPESYPQQPRQQAGDPQHRQSAEEEYEDEEEEYEDEEEEHVGGGGAVGEVQHSHPNDETEQYEDEDEEQYDEQYAEGGYAR